jgi:hypothetical protein
MQEAEITTGELVKARKDMTKMLDLVDKALDQMALAVQPRIVVMWLLAARMRWDHRLSASLKHKVDKVLTCKDAVCNHILANQTPVISTAFVLS